jgi:hypothetical protein
MEFLDFTSVTLDEFQQLVPPFEAAFQAHMAAWRLDGPAGAFKQEPTVLNKPLCRKYLSDRMCEAQKTYINLVVRSKAILGLKSTRKLISEINVQLLDRPQVFLLGKTVGSCTDAPAGPRWETPHRPPV